MTRLTALVHDAIRAVVKSGDTVVDATAGNGHDTIILAQLVGPSGCVYAFDIQPEALSATATRLAEHGLHNVKLIKADHAELEQHISVPIAAAMFNLGYLPGGDHSVITQPSTTVAALASACRLLRRGGIVTVMAYVGHSGGPEEAKAVKQFCDQINSEFYSVEHKIPEAENAPRLTVICKRVEERL